MTKYKVIFEYLKKHNGTISIKAAEELGVQKQYLYNLVKEGRLEKVGRGMFVDLGSFEDKLFIYQQRYRRGVFSHGTALYLHNLTDRVPLKYTMTFPTDYNITKVEESGLETYRTMEGFHSMSVESIKTNQGNDVQVYSIEKTLCDIVRWNSKVERELVVDAFKRYATSSKKNLDLLFKLSTELKVKDTIRKYMEVLL